MRWTTKLLVIASRTVDSAELLEAIVDRAAVGPLHVTLVAPASSGARSAGDRHAATLERLEHAKQRLAEAGVPVEGHVGDPDPMVAVQDAWDPRRFDEVFVATLPTGLSRWLAADLPRRIERFTGARVTHIIGAERRPRTSTPSAMLR